MAVSIFKKAEMALCLSAVLFFLVSCTHGSALAQNEVIPGIPQTANCGATNESLLHSRKLRSQYPIDRYISEESMIPRYLKAVTDLNGLDALGIFLIALSCTIAVTVGAGGGGLFVPIMILVMGFTPHQSTGLSQSLMAGGTLAGFLLNASRPHPLVPGRPLIDFDQVLLLGPAMIGGAMVGVFISGMIAPLMLMILMVVALSFSAFKVTRQAIRAIKNERIIKRHRTRTKEICSLASMADSFVAAKGEALSSDPNASSIIGDPDKPLPVAVKLPSAAVLEVPNMDKRPLTRSSSDITAESTDAKFVANAVRRSRSGLGASKWLSRSSSSCFQCGDFSPVLRHDEVASRNALQGSLEEPNKLMVRYNTYAGSSSHLARSISFIFEKRQEFISKPGDGDAAMLRKETSIVLNPSTPSIVSVAIESAPGSGIRSTNKKQSLCRVYIDWKKFGILAVIYVINLVLTVLRGGKNSSLIVNFCSASYWVIYSAGVLYLLICSMMYGYILVKRQNAKAVEDLGENTASSGHSPTVETCLTEDRLEKPSERCFALSIFGKSRDSNPKVKPRNIPAGVCKKKSDLVPGDIIYRPKILVAWLITSFSAGVIAGIVGIGGSMILSPLMLERGCLPQVVSAVNALLVLISASTAATAFIVSGQVELQWAAILAGVCFFSALCGKFFVDRLVRKSGKASLLVLMLLALIIMSATAMLVSGILGLMRDSAAYLTFRDPCGNPV